tara:strand:- start:465 stop:932 length:468 start_codon:yes stop_codon:yes gene_type:complete
MPLAPDVYDRLKTTKLEDLTLSQLNQAIKASYINKDQVNLWSQAITLDRSLDAGRTYPHALPIPELSAVSSNTIADGAVATFKPTGTEIYRVEVIDSSANVVISLFDGTTNCQLMSGSDPVVFSNLFLTSTLYLAMTNGSGSSATTTIAYHKVGL